MFTAYLVGFVAMVALFAVRAPDQNLRHVFVICVVWPVSIVALLLLMIGMLVGVDVSAYHSTQRFGFSKATNPKYRGFSVTIFNNEFQFISLRRS